MYAVQSLVELCISLKRINSGVKFSQLNTDMIVLTYLLARSTEISKL